MNDSRPQARILCNDRQLASTLRELLGAQVAAEQVLCEAGDLIAVPDSMTHWFDMGPEPSFVAIRFFTEPDGWVGHFTGTDIAQRFPRYEPGQAG